MGGLYDELGGRRYFFPVPGRGLLTFSVATIAEQIENAADNEWQLYFPFAALGVNNYFYLVALGIGQHKKRWRYREALFSLLLAISIPFFVIYSVDPLYHKFRKPLKNKLQQFLDIFEVDL